jgi:dolichol-phosphate mannosyltransferase
MHYHMTVLIPPFNERENIGRMVTIVDGICKAHSINEEILVVDDNSRDGTIVVVETLMNEHRNLHLLVRKEKTGLSQSLYAGMLHAQADLVQCLDCDFSHPPEKIPLVYHHLHDMEYDMVIGSRYMRGGVINWPVPEKLLPA